MINDLQLLSTFEIAPQWRPVRAGVTQNEESASRSVVKSSVPIVRSATTGWASHDRAMTVLNWQGWRALARITGMFG
jgi:hypothetical protein